jgi:hypothetical protein
VKRDKGALRRIGGKVFERQIGGEEISLGGAPFDPRTLPGGELVSEEGGRGDERDAMVVAGDSMRSGDAGEVIADYEEIHVEDERDLASGGEGHFTVH